MTRVIPPEWEDQNGHVNIRFYMTLFERGGWPMVHEMGMDESYFRDRRQGLFDLEHHLYYVYELHVGESVSIHARLIDRSEKRFHGVMFIVNDSRDNLAATLEYITSGADLAHRRTAPLPADIAARLDALLAAHRRLPWEPPLCGVMSA
ncbi:MAG: thioesterase [Gammaproteobacteria bacterium]|jgi:acyl-CoA thioester hydrolase|nr:thioesterase [Gammaproteobacteria bacterium]